MTPKDIYLDIQNKLGVVPEFVKSIPDSLLELEWDLLQRVQMDEGAIPNK
jgi:hypothetical protein